MTNQFASMFCRLSLALRLAVMVVILGYLVVPRAAIANPLVYDLIPPVTAGLTGDITVIGDFTFDPTTTAPDAVDLDVTGGPQPGEYTQSIEGFAAAISASIPGSDMDLVMSFQNDLAAVPDPITKVLFLMLNGMNMSFTATAGEAVPASAVPEPASLHLLGGAIGLFLLTRWANDRGRIPIAARQHASRS